MVLTGRIGPMVPPTSARRAKTTPWSSNQGASQMPCSMFSSLWNSISARILVKEWGQTLVQAWDMIIIPLRLTSKINTVLTCAYYENYLLQAFLYKQNFTFIKKASIGTFSKLGFDHNNIIISLITNEGGGGDGTCSSRSVHGVTPQGWWGKDQDPYCISSIHSL